MANAIQITGIDKNPLIDNKNMVELSIDDEDFSSAKFHQKFDNELNLQVF